MIGGQEVNLEEAFVKADDADFDTAVEYATNQSTLKLQVRMNMQQRIKQIEQKYFH